MSTHQGLCCSRYRSLRAGAVLFVSLFFGCGETERETHSVAPRQVSLRNDFVTPDVARHFDASGLFVLPPHHDAGGQLLDEARAKEIARLWTRDYGPFMRGTLERDRGAPIVLSALMVCGRAYYAEPPWEVAGHLPFVRRAFGPKWLVSFCAPDGSSHVSVAVSAHNTHLKIEKDAIVWPGLGGGVHGGEFFAMGVPRGAEGLPVSPERAVEIAATMTGRRAATVPQLFLPTHDTGPPQAARWRVSLDLPATVVRSADGERVTTKEVFVGLTSFIDRPPEVFVAAPESDQPTHVDMRSPDGVGVPAVIRVMRRSGTATNQLTVTAVGSKAP